MILFFLELLCSFLIAMSLVFIVIQIKAKFDKSFLIFGISNLLLCSFSAIDIWLQPTTQILHWTKIQHILASFFPPIILWYIMVSVRRENLNIIKWLNLISIAIAVLFLTDLMFVPKGTELISTFLYNVTFAPYMLLSILAIFILSVSLIGKSPAYQKRFLIFHTIGILLLAVGGILDMIAVLRGSRVSSLIPNFSIVGILCFCSAVNLLFIEKLASIILERESTFKKLQNAYHELEEAQALKELGQSTAMINHEIRNYAASVSGYAEMISLNCELDEFGQKLINNIIETINRMANFSKEILDFSKANIVKNKAPIDLLAVAKKCVENHFEKKTDYFDFAYTGENSFVVNGDWHKLDQVFTNLFKNAIEANADKITASFKQSSTTLLCDVVDNGTGCSKENLKNLFKAFHTSKRDSGGTGLGMCVVRSIIEGHGGRISAYSRNDEKRGHGLGIHIVFPKFSAGDNDKELHKNNIVFITQGIRDLSVPLQVFRNSLINPLIYKDVHEIQSDIFLNKTFVLIATPNSVQQFKARFNLDITIHVLVEDPTHGLFVIDENGEQPPTPFSEDFLISCILSYEYSNA